MGWLSRIAVAGALLATALGSAGCSGSPLPGAMLGTYQVTAASGTNTCGLGMPNPWVFDVQLSHDQSTLYWSWLDGTPPLFAPLDASKATLTATEVANVDGTVDGGLGPCTIAYTMTAARQ